MKNVFSLVRRAPARIAVIGAIAATVLVPAAAFAWGPSRATFTTAHPATYVTFNSITDNPVQGDERNFMQVRAADASNTTYSDSISLTPGKDYVVYMYYHNNAASDLNASGKGIATGTYAKAQIPAIVAAGSKSTSANGFVGAANANPKEVFDDITFANATSGDIALRYVAGSATIHNLGKADGSTLSDSIVTTGAQLGYDKIDGVVPGCNDYAGYVTFRVHADQADFSISKQVRVSGTSSWTKTVTAVAGNKVDYQLQYKNTGSTTQSNVVLKDMLPAGVSYVKGSTYLVNDANTTPKNVSDNLVSSTGINIGSYAPGANAYLKFSATIEGADQLACGTNTFVNTASAETNNGSKSDTATVTVSKACTTPPTTTTPGTPAPLPSTGPTGIVVTVLALGAAAYAVAYAIAARRSAKNML